MKKLNGLLALALGAGMAMPAALSAQQRETLTVSGQLTGNLSATSDYRFRGLSRTFGDPALQGGLEFALPSNFYVATWASVVDKEIFANSSGYEVDLVGGYRQQIGSGIGLDVGLIQYLFPSESEFSTLEAFGGLGWEWFSVKYYYTLSNRYFGAGNAKGTQYLDLTADYPLGNGLSVVGHFGITRGQSGARDYTDWRLGVNKDWRGFKFGVSYYDTDSDFEFTNRAGNTRDLGDGGIVLSVSKSF
jgi:uncharacterized protein (TIGR02001 family)